MTGPLSSSTTPTGSPFDPAPSGAAGTAIRGFAVTAGIVLALGAAWWFTRRDPPAAGAAAAGAAPVASTDSGRTAVALTAEAARRIGVTYAAVERRSLTSEVRTVGLVSYDETRVKTIAPKIDGYVEQLFVASTGQPVEEGEPLLRIYSPMLVSAEEELLLARRLASDVAGGNTDAAANAAALLGAARRRLRNWDIPDDEIARLERTGEVQKTVTLRSPLRGIVSQKNVQSGQRIMAGDPVYQVADLHEVWLEGEVFERDLAAMRIGQMVFADFTAMPGAPREGRIVYIAPTVSAETRTTVIRVALSNHDMTLKPGMYASLRVRGDARPRVLSVPRSAVLVTGQRVLVFVKGADGMLASRSVDLGTTTDDWVEIVRGVAAGETVVASATFLIDAESNLGSALGAMANMPGMEMGASKTAPVKPAPVTKAPVAKPDPMANMPGMDPTAKKKP